ncbi:MAG: hypothetical protein DHS20C16_22410 [Phycisphaerae bacterium]|nr:MAG: hypothetical protein DHS20C16_22410 [Phycisphaerae bacterium]
MRQGAERQNQLFFIITPKLSKLILLETAHKEGPAFVAQVHSAGGQNVSALSIQLQEWFNIGGVMYR